MRVRRPQARSLPESEVTPESIFLNRRELVRRAALLGAGLAVWGTRPGLAGADEPITGKPATTGGEPSRYPAARNAQLSVDLALTPEELAAKYNNFYEFGPDKQIAGRAQRLDVDPWTIEIGGLVEEPLKIGVEDLVRRFELEERVYRFRCVETWAMVVPWTGIPLRKVVEWARPRPEARYIRFESFHRPTQAPYQLLAFWYPWPYTEGLTLAEARNELSMLVTGVYGKPLPKQHGAPVRLIVPWKYGFKSLKSIVKIEFTREQPKTFWNTIAPEEYDFTANVNPTIAHPRWSQASEKLLGKEERQPTLLYNGYARWVAPLYRG